MPSVAAGMLLVGALVALGVASSRVSARLGLPVLVLFMGVGMAAGSEGLGGVPFEDYGLANAVGTVALALILFDGGLQTPLASVRAAWRPALALSTIGVALTARWSFDRLETLHDAGSRIWSSRTPTTTDQPCPVRRHG